MHAFLGTLVAPRWASVLALASLCLFGVGCAGPVWADHKTKRAVQAAAADDSFPSAAEVGLAAAPAKPTQSTR